MFFATHSYSCQHPSATPPANHHVVNTCFGSPGPLSIYYVWNLVLGVISCGFRLGASACLDPQQLHRWTFEIRSCHSTLASSLRLLQYLGPRNCNGNLLLDLSKLGSGLVGNLMQALRNLRRWTYIFLPEPPCPMSSHKSCKQQEQPSEGCQTLHGHPGDSWQRYAEAVLKPAEMQTSEMCEILVTTG